MGNMKEYLRIIKNAIFGKDMRGAIHDAINEMHNETCQNTTRQDLLEKKYDEQIKNIAGSEVQSAEVVDARCGFDTLGSVIKQKVYHFENVEKIKNCLTLLPGDVCETLGYYEANDGGGARYVVRLKGDEDVEDGGSIHFTVTKLVVELLTGKNKNVLQYGVDKKGAKDCSVIVQNIIDNCNCGDTVYFPNGNYLFNNSINMKDDILVKGSFKNKYNTINETSRLFFNNVNGFTKYDDENGSNYFEGLVIIGNNKYGNAFSNLRLKLHRCSISNFGCAVANCRESVIDECEIFQNNVGIMSLIDSKVINNFIYNNVKQGILLGAGQNDNIISNNKIEWNNMEGILLYSCTHNVVSNNIIDRSGTYGLTINDSKYCVISDNVFRRNYIKEGVNDIYSHMRIEKSSHCTLTGNCTRTGNSLDDGTGITVPSTGIYITTSSDLILMSNDFSGAVNKHVAKYNNSGNIYEMNLGFNIVDYVKSSVKNVTISEGTGSINFNVDTPQNNGLPTHTKIGILTRKTDNSSGTYKEIIATIYYKYNSSYVVTLSETNIDGTITVNSSFVDGVLTLTFSNASSRNIKCQQIYV